MLDKLPTPDWKAFAKSIEWDVRPLIDGARRQSTSSQSVASVNPADETTLYELPVGSSDDVAAAVDIARQRFEEVFGRGSPPVNEPTRS